MATQVTPDEITRMGYEELGRHTLGSNGTTLTVDNLPARKYLLIVHNCVGVAGVATSEVLRFNNISSGSYDHRRSIANTPQALVTGDTGFNTYGDIGAQSFGRYEVVNTANLNKTLQGQRTVGYPNGSSGVTWVDIAGVFRNTAAAVTRVDYICVTGSFMAGSELIIYGHD